MTSSSCKFITPWVTEGAKILMQVFFVVSFLSLFFFLYVVKVEKRQFVTQVNLIVDNIMKDLKSTASFIVPNTSDREKLQKILQNLIENWKLPSKHYEHIRKNNEALMSKTKHIVIILAVVVAAVLISLLVLRFCLNLTRGFVENIIILVFIGVTELLFLTVVAGKYISADPNKVKYSILTVIENFAQTKTNTSEWIKGGGEE